MKLKDSLGFFFLFVISEFFATHVEYLTRYILYSSFFSLSFISGEEREDRKSSRRFAAIIIPVPLRCQLHQNRVALFV